MGYTYNDLTPVTETQNLISVSSREKLLSLLNMIGPLIPPTGGASGLTPARGGNTEKKRERKTFNKSLPESGRVL